MNLLKKNYLVLIINIFLLKICFAQIAVFPFEDLSKDLNGIDLNISTKIADKLVDNGFNVIYPFQIIEFMDSEHLSTVGWVDKITAKKIEKYFKCNLILIGTILDYKPQEFSLGLNIRLLDISNYKLIWGKTVFFSKAEAISLLNLKHKTWKKIVNSLVAKIISNIPGHILAKGVSNPEIDIDEIYISPKYAKKGQFIECKLKLISSFSNPDEVKFFIDNKIVIIPNRDKEYLVAKWKAPKKNGRYSLSMLAVWKEPYNFKKKIFLTTFYVDSTPPVLELKIKKGFLFKKKIFFNKYIKIIPRIKNRDVISRWKLEIFSELAKSPLILLEQYSNLPKFFTWKGVSAKGGPLPNGKYYIQLSVWDRAINSDKKIREVFLVKSLPNIKITGSYDDNNNLTVEFNYLTEKFVPIVFFRLELIDEFGNLFAFKEGEKYPDKIIFKKIANRKKIFFNLEEKDILGNKLFLKKKILHLENKEKDKEKRIKKKIWINDF